MNKILSICVAACLAFSSSVFAADSTSKPVVSAAPVTQPATKSTANTQQEIVNINTADSQALTKLKGIGAKKADAIVAWRKANGSFKTIDQFADVKGIGAKTLEANRKNIRI